MQFLFDYSELGHMLTQFINNFTFYKKILGTLGFDLGSPGPWVEISILTIVLSSPDEEMKNKTNVDKYYETLVFIKI